MKWHTLLILVTLILLSTQVIADEQFNIGNVGDEQLKIKSLGGDEQFEFTITVRIKKEELPVEVIVATGAGATGIEFEDTPKPTLIEKVEEIIDERKPLLDLLMYLFIFCLLLWLSKRRKVIIFN